ncbi:MAG: hypothetical protein WCG47_02320 [Dermatophilaceae bacterium]
MVNLTITVDDATLKRARVRAAQRGESVNGYLAQMLRSYADTPDQATLFGEIAAIAQQYQGSRSPGRRWTRDELHRHDQRHRD